MRYFHRIIIFLIGMVLFSSHLMAMSLFLEGLSWRATETNDWAYVNSLTVPNQNLDYKTIDFSYSPGFRGGFIYNSSTWDALFSYTHFYTTTHDLATGNIQPGFLGSVTAKPSHAYLYQSGDVNQTINYNIFNLNVGKEFYPTTRLMLHPLLGLIGGSINQTIKANYQGTTTSKEKIINDFSGIGPKMGVNVYINLENEFRYPLKFFISFASGYLLGHWEINDFAEAGPFNNISIEGGNHSMGAWMLESTLGFQFLYKQLAFNIAYEINDWFDQVQFFDNDTGAHNNDLILQGLSVKLTYQFM